MMGEGSYMAPEAPVVGNQFMAPCSVDLTIVPKMMTLSACTFVVMDANDNIVFKVGKFMSHLAPRILLDAAATPIVSFHKKSMSLHSTRKVYRGDSKDSRDLLFTVKKSLFNTTLNVFLASNTKKEHCDFKIRGNWSEKSCTIYSGTSSNVIAQMHRRHRLGRTALGNDQFVVTVFPHVDYAFIITLIVILEEISEEGQNNGRAAG
ncbi:hypothetical protein ACET3Z_027668 [Daucus carota]